MAEVPVKVWRLGRNSDSLYLLILRGEGERPLPMVIGPCEAMAIWSVVGRGARTERRPMTHDLLRDLTEQLGGRIVKVVIDDLWNGVYYAKLHIAVDGEVVTVDARPSDAVALGLRAEAPLFATDSVLVAASAPESSGEPGESAPETQVDLDDL